MTCDLNTLFDHSVVKELVSRLLPALQNLLNNVVPVDIFAHFFNSVHEVALDQHKMFVNLCNFYKFLHRSGSMGVFAECNRFISHLLDNLSELLFIATVR